MEGCPCDDEIERPQNKIELISGDDSWREVGLRFKWTEPAQPSDNNVTLGEPIRLRVAVEAKKDVSDAEEEISAFCWTNTRFAENRCGLWKDIKLFENPKCRCEGPLGVVTHVYQGSLAPDVENSYRITFNVKWKQFMVWANYFQIDGMLHVSRNHTSGEIQMNVPVNFPCDYDIQHGDTRCVWVPDPTQGPPGNVPPPDMSRGPVQELQRQESFQTESSEGCLEYEGDHVIEVRIQALDYCGTPLDSKTDGERPDTVLAARNSLRTVLVLKYSTIMDGNKIKVSSNRIPVHPVFIKA
ncbi:hypothetical protein ElyMa_002040700 [Elysia marginata]|uniref:Uncharacterized protein n=1 Tax=Elysia marginata TaxID=1093978 RepID=A0AAV4F9S7_9GAST|nr:hypothetical protein ElyMa_002040700 [Elysia marginata]